MSTFGSEFIALKSCFEGDKQVLLDALEKGKLRMVSDGSFKQQVGTEKPLKHKNVIKNGRQVSVEVENDLIFYPRKGQS